MIDNDDLSPKDVPNASAGWDVIGAFALTFPGYDIHGSFERCASIANEQKHETLIDLRTCLFFEQRRWRHFGDEPDGEAMDYIRSLVRQNRERVDERRADAQPPAAIDRRRPRVG